MSFETKLQHNIWDTNLDEVLNTIKSCHGDNKFDMSKWTWVKNPRCKYISIRIDMRDGAFVLVDRDGERISLEHLKYQYSEENQNPPKAPKDSKYDGVMLEKARKALVEIVASNIPGGGEAVFDIAKEALDSINEHLGTEC